MYMSQLNINMTPEFEELLKRYMELNGIRHKSEAIRKPLQTAVAVDSESKETTMTLRDMLGAALRAPRNPKHRFRTDDDLWADEKK